MAEAKSSTPSPKAPSSGSELAAIIEVLLAAREAVDAALNPAEETSNLFHKDVDSRKPTDTDQKVLKNVTGPALDAIETARDTLNQTLAANAATFATTEATDSATLKTALAQFESAVKTFQADETKNEAVLDSAVKTAQSVFDRSATQTDALSRQWVLYYQMEITISSAIETAQSAKAGDLSTLLTAFGTLLAAFGTYWGAVAGAKATQENADATAWETYWTTVEDTLDPN